MVCRCCINWSSHNPAACLQLQEASLQLARTQHSYEELQRKQEALITDMESAIARRSAIQIKVSTFGMGSSCSGSALCLSPLPPNLDQDRLCMCPTRLKHAIASV